MGTEEGKVLFDVMIQVCEDGRIDDDEVLALKEWLDSSEYPEDIAAFRFLHKLLDDVLQDNVISEDERFELQSAILRILPKNYRDEAEAKTATAREEYWEQRLEQDRVKPPATEPQQKFIRELGGDASRPMAKREASSYIDELLASQPVAKAAESVWQIISDRDSVSAVYEMNNKTHDRAGQCGGHEHRNRSERKCRAAQRRRQKAP